MGLFNYRSPVEEGADDGGSEGRRAGSPLRSLYEGERGGAVLPPLGLP